MTGISEILVLFFLICVVLILPRMFKPAPPVRSSGRDKSLTIKKLTVKMRTAIVASIAYPAAMALVLKPWHQDLVLFLLAGMMPVALFWAVVWIMAGKKN